MSCRRYRASFAAIGRCGVVCATLIGLLAGSVGFTDPPDISIGGAFPCQGSRCGCRTAEDCWFGCCCRTPSQRLAWAKRNGVTPPQAFLRIAGASIPEARGVAACCSRPSADEQSEETQAKRRCCSPSKGSCCAPRNVASNSDSQGKPPAIRTNGCGGRSQQWVTEDQPLSLAVLPGNGFEPKRQFSVLLLISDYTVDPAAPPTRPG